MIDHEQKNDERFDDVAAAVGSADEVNIVPDGPKGGAPEIIPIGHCNGSYYFISKDGEKREFTAREMVRLNLSSLFGGDTAWLCENFPVYSKKGNIVPGEFSPNKAAEWLMRACSAKGLFNPDTPLRGIGVWRHKDDVIAHLGGRLWYRGDLCPAGRKIGAAIYTAKNDLEEPDFANPASKADGRQLRAHLGAWAFMEHYDGDLLFGFIGAALLGGYPNWRVHALVTGERGSGKSTLADMIMAVIGAMGTSMNDYTEAGLRQTLANDARTLHIDEGESAGEDRAHRMAKVVGLLRLMSGGVGAKIARGSSGGKALNTTVTGCVLMTAINPPPLQPQDRSRIMTIAIDKPDVSRVAADLEYFVTWAKDMSPRFRARALLGARRFGATFALFRGELVTHGCDARQADLYATLCAGRSLLIDDDVPSQDCVLAFVTAMQNRLRLIMLDDSDASDAMLCLNRLLDSSCEAIRDGIKRSIGELVGDAMEIGHAPTEENNKLKPLGLRIIDIKVGKEKMRALFVANDHIGLKRIFHNTPWADGNWRSSLIRLPGVAPSPKPVAVGRKSRGLLIPESLLPAPDDGNTVDFTPDPAPPDVSSLAAQPVPAPREAPS